MLFRGFVISAISFVTTWPTDWETLRLAFVGFFVFWVVFEVILNRLRDKDALYVGKTAKMDIWARKTFPNNTGLNYLILKLFLLTLTIII